MEPPTWCWLSLSSRRAGGDFGKKINIFKEMK